MKPYSAIVVAAVLLVLASTGAEAACINSAACSSLQYCRKADAMCVPKLLAGSSCTYDITCASLKCNAGTCTLQTNGIRCTASTQCLSGNCNNSMCAAKVANGASCTKAANCISGYCNTTLFKCASSAGSVTSPAITSTTTTKSATTSTSTTTAPSTPVSSPVGASTFFPKGKAGLSGGQAMKYFYPYLGWWNDWTPDPYKYNTFGRQVPAAAMLWGLGRLNHDDDITRFNTYTNTTIANQYPYQMGFNEFDFTGVGSSGKMLLNESVAAWEKYIAPKKALYGAKLISPSCAQGRYETLCGQFINNVTTKVDAVSVHIFRPSIAEVNRTLQYFRKYNLPLVVSELACIDYEVKPAYFCNQTEINAWWPAVIDLMESSPFVAGYAASDANNGAYASFTNSTDGTLTETGQMILNKLKSRTIAKRSKRYPIARSNV